MTVVCKDIKFPSEKGIFLWRNSLIHKSLAVSDKEYITIAKATEAFAKRINKFTNIYVDCGNENWKYVAINDPESITNIYDSIDRKCGIKVSESTIIIDDSEVVVPMENYIDAFIDEEESSEKPETIEESEEISEEIESKEEYEEIPVNEDDIHTSEEIESIDDTNYDENSDLAEEYEEMNNQEMETAENKPKQQYNNQYRNNNIQRKKRKH